MVKLVCSNQNDNGVDDDDNGSDDAEERAALAELEDSLNPIKQNSIEQENFARNQT